MMMRRVAAAFVVILGLAAFHRLVVVPWHCNVVIGRVSAATERAWPLLGSDRAREVANQNLTLLQPCLEWSPTDVNLAMLAAANYRLLHRSEVASAFLVKALSHERRPELYFELGQTQLATGGRAEALQNFIRSGTFAGTHAFGEIADPEVRSRAYVEVGRRQEELLARQGRLDTRNRLLGIAGATFNAATSTRENDVMHVLAPHADSGIRFQWRDGDVVPRALTTAWVFVRRGRVYLGSGNGSEPRRDAHSSTTGRWEKLEAINQTCPVTETILSAHGPEGAEFLVREIRSRATLAAPPCAP